jgi:ribosome biogenesis protein YTM1
LEANIKMNESSDNEDEQQKISVRFILAPKHDTSLEVPADAIAIPSNLRRRGLSTLVNHMLGRKVANDDNDMDKEEEDDDDDEDALPSIRFDFILNGKLLRMGVEAAVRRDGLSMEESVEIQYFCAQEAPSSSGESETLPDWISALSYTAFVQPFLPKEGLLFSGCYDGTIRALEGGNCATLTSTKAHTSAIKCMDTLVIPAHSTGDEQSGTSVAEQLMVATGSMDQTLLTHVLTEGKKSGKPKLKLHGVFSGGHQNAVESLAVVQRAKGKVMMASGDWDGQLCLWDVPTSPDDNADEATASNKKRKTALGAKKSVLNAPEIMPSASIKAHASGVSGISWGLSETHLITSSWDHSAKVWDVERQESILSLVGSRVVSAMDRCSNSNIIATGHVSRDVHFLSFASTLLVSSN